MRLESHAQTRQLGSNLCVVIDFAIENDDVRAVFCSHGLIATSEIDDLEPDGAKGYTARFESPRLVGPPMMDAAGRLANALRPRHPVTVCEACDAAHLPFLLSQDLDQGLESRIHFALPNDVRRQEAQDHIVRAVDQKPFGHAIDNNLLARFG
jgi:hypothetical protein